MATTVLQQPIPMSGIRFSAHSRQRMMKRGLDFTAAQLARVEQALVTLKAKGSRTSVVMLDDAALVVSVPQSTVVTVVDREQLREQVFTNIDSAVFA
nr:TIGR02530 family flagellar biosynthesis protein [uncultured Desulfuromonas sp.]